MRVLGCFVLPPSIQSNHVRRPQHLLRQCFLSDEVALHFDMSALSGSTDKRVCLGDPCANPSLACSSECTCYHGMLLGAEKPAPIFLRFPHCHLLNSGNGFVLFLDRQCETSSTSCLFLPSPFISPFVFRFYRRPNESKPWLKLHRLQQFSMARPCP